MWKYKLYNILLNVNRKQSCLLNHEFLHIQTFWMSRRWHLSIERRPLQTASENKSIFVESERDAEITLLRNFMGGTWIEGIASGEQESGLFTKNKDSFTHLPLSITKLRVLDALNDIPAQVNTFTHLSRRACNSWVDSESNDKFVNWQLRHLLLFGFLAIRKFGIRIL